MRVSFPESDKAKLGHVAVAAIEARGSSQVTALPLGIDLQNLHRLRKQNKSTIPSRSESDMTVSVTVQDSIAF